MPSSLVSDLRRRQAIQPMRSFRAPVRVCVRWARYKSDAPAPFGLQPGPPRLPAKDQAEFEALQRLANTQAVVDEFNSEHGNEEAVKEKLPLLKTNSVGTFAPYPTQTIPEFEGDVNPVTGEVGGPKQDPLRHNEWAFNGRTTDF